MKIKRMMRSKKRAKSVEKLRGLDSRKEEG